jgi:hypothetical protein
MFENWKTTVAGFVLSFSQWFYTTDGNFTWKGFVAALPTLILGLYAQDRKKSNGQ